MNIISVCSFKGGTAKTSIALNLGALLAKENNRVLVVDFDAQANLTAGLNFDPDNYDSMAAVLQDRKKISDVILKNVIDGLDLIPADTWLERVEVTGSLASDRYSHEKLKKSLEPLDYDIIIIDTPPSLCWLTESALIAATDVLVCTTPEFYSIKGLQRLSYFMHYIAERHPFHLIGVIISFWNMRGKHNKDFIKVIEQTFPGKLLQTKVRRDIAISEAAILGKPVFQVRPKSRATEDFQNLNREILTKMSSGLTPEKACLN